MCLRLMDKMGCLDLKVLMLEEPKWGIDVPSSHLGLQPNLFLGSILFRKITTRVSFDEF